jgi:hypothetical protein
MLTSTFKGIDCHKMQHSSDGEKDWSVLNEVGHRMYRIQKVNERVVNNEVRHPFGRLLKTSQVESTVVKD